MLLLIVWMHIDGMNVMTVQAGLTAELCDSMSEAMAAQPDVRHVVCTRDPARVERAIQEGQCSPIENRDSFVNYACKNAAPKGNSGG
jgi:hypothetical protein